MQHKYTYTLLILAGCLPFLVAAVSPYLGIFDWPFVGNLQNAVAYYALAVASFMAGTNWGIALSFDVLEKPSNSSPLCPKQLMLVSSVSVLAPWIALCTTGISIAYYFSLAVVFVLMILMDYRLQNRNILTSHYITIRLFATLIVVTSLISLAFTA